MNRRQSMVTTIFSALALALLMAATATAFPNSQRPASGGVMESAGRCWDASICPASSPEAPATGELEESRTAHARAPTAHTPLSIEGNVQMTNLEKWKAFRVEKQARMNAMIATIRAEARSFGLDEAAEFHTLESDIANADAQILIEERIQARELSEAAASAQPARPRGIAAAPAILTKTTQAERNGDKFKGETFMRVIRQKALGAARNLDLSVFAAQEVKRGRPDVADFMRKFAANEVPGGGEKSGEWGSELVHSDQFTADFIELLRERTVFDQLGLREVPANVTIKGQDGTGTAYWVGEGNAIPMSKADFSSVNLAPLKVGALSAISLELLEDSSPAALQLVQESLIADSAQLIDSRFFSATAASNGVSPAGIVNGVSGTASAGTDQNGLITDVDVLTQAFITAKNTGGLKFVSRPALAQKVAGFVSFAGTPVYPGLSESGGTFQNKPWLASDNVVSGDLLLIKPQDIFRIGDRGLSIDISMDATLEFASDPTGSALANGSVPVAQSKQAVSLFQSGMVGVRLLRRINWAKRRASAVARITGAAYVPQVQTA